MITIRTSSENYQGILRMLGSAFNASTIAPVDAALRQGAVAGLGLPATRIERRHETARSMHTAAHHDIEACVSWARPLARIALVKRPVQR